MPNVNFIYIAVKQRPRQSVLFASSFILALFLSLSLAEFNCALGRRVIVVIASDVAAAAAGREERKYYDDVGVPSPGCDYGK
jgi:hypothetical protein